MIAFACSHCALKLTVMPEFAGRSAKCPACKQPLTVPRPDATQGYVSNGQLDGTTSSVARAGIDGGVTLEPPTKKGQKSLGEMLARRGKSAERYIIEGEIARGGMGAVLRAIDCDIRREVAVKYMLDPGDARKRLRFVEEAQITGQLEHPHIVPIHELGIDAQKRLFFTMKMVKGRSLADVLDVLRKDPHGAGREFTLTRLLGLFVNICHALAYAHARGVVHRDLKPANIMLGDFGEVYVMDWGLAKVLGSKTGATPAAGAELSKSAPGVAVKVSTSREPEADLTQEGAVVGTPVYMPPEQASGKLDAIDARSDIYSLGAILYELLVLKPPIDKEGGSLAILMRVATGEIVAPERRDPSRARAGHIPGELSAVAMKALAKEPGDRFQTVEALRRDIELYLEGRSVSAKEDTKRELIWKFVKRNKGLSAGIVAALLVLACSTIFLSLAWWETSRAKASSDLAQKEKDKRTKEAVPALVEAGRLAVERKKFSNAHKQVDLAILYAPDYVEAHLLKGQLLILDLKFADAKAEFEKCLDKPADSHARSLLDLCNRPRPDDVSNLLMFAKVFEQQELPALANELLAQHGANSFEARQRLLDLHRQKIEKAWPGLGSKLTMDATGIYSLDIRNQKEATNLAPLEGMPLTRLELAGCPVRDLTPLKGMPLTGLGLWWCREVRELTPLKGMPLTTLNLERCEQVTDLTPLTGLPLETLNLAWSNVSDLSPLKGMPLVSLNLCHCTRLTDLTPLQGLPLTYLDLRDKGPNNLVPLEGLKLTEILLPDQTTKSSMNSLRRIGSLAKIHYWSAEEFWKQYDAGKFPHWQK